MSGDDFEAWRASLQPPTVSIGDPVEVMGLVRLSPHAGKAHETFGETWRPATVCHVSDAEIGVAFADHSRMAIPRRSRQWRPA